MQKVKVDDLTGEALDWAVGFCRGAGTPYIGSGGKRCMAHSRYSSSWEAGGPVSEAAFIRSQPYSDYTGWYASKGAAASAEGPTELVAKMRCYVKSIVGETVQVPKELLKWSRV